MFRVCISNVLPVFPSPPPLLIRCLQLYVFVAKCIAYHFNAKQPTDMARRQLKAGSFLPSLPSPPPTHSLTHCPSIR
jgi:hypothetical protein